MIKYIGQNGEYFLGIPKRDLTDEEFTALSQADQALVLNSSVYQQVTDEPASAPRATKKTEQPVTAPAGG